MRHNKELYYLIAATVATRLPWVFMLPMYDAPDENTHFYIIKFMADHVQLPGPAELTAGGKESVYVPLPHFGYVPHVLAHWSLKGIFDPTLAHRFGSFLIAPLMTYFSWWLGRQLFPGQKLLALAIPLLVVFHPQLVFVHSYSNNDVTSSTIAAALLCACAIMIQRGLSMPVTIGIGLLCGWLALTKYTGYAVLPAVAAGFLLSAWIHRTAFVKLAYNAVSALALAACISAPWFIRNYQLYNGDFMGAQTMRQNWAALYDKPMEYYVSPFKILLDRKWWRLMFFSYWGMFGYFTKPLLKPLYWTYTTFLAISFIGAIKSLMNQIRSSDESFFTRVSKVFGETDRAKFQTHALWLIMLVCLLANLTAMLISSAGNVGGPQGRYLFTSEIPFLASLVFGLGSIGKTWGGRLVTALIGFNVIVYFWSFITLYQAYGFHWKVF